MCSTVSPVPRQTDLSQRNSTVGHKSAGFDNGGSPPGESIAEVGKISTGILHDGDERTLEKETVESRKELVEDLRGTISTKSYSHIEYV